MLTKLLVPVPAVSTKLEVPMRILLLPVVRVVEATATPTTTLLVAVPMATPLSSPIPVLSLAALVRPLKARPPTTVLPPHRGDVPGDVEKEGAALLALSG